MTRKKYMHKLQELSLAIARHPESKLPENYKVGNSLRNIKDHIKDVPKSLGSYENAWNSEVMVWACEFYGVKR